MTISEYNALKEKYDIALNNFGIRYKTDSIAWSWVSGINVREFIYGGKGNREKRLRPHVIIYIGNSSSTDFAIPCETVEDAQELAKMLYLVADVKW